MELTPKELMKQYVDSQNFTSTTEIMQAMKDLFRDAIQQVMESELDVELGYEKSERQTFRISLSLCIYGCNSLQSKRKSSVYN